MKNSIWIAIRLTLVSLVLFGVLYPLAIWAIAQAAPSQGRGERIEADGRSYYYHIGQSFTDPKYFQSRPSAVNYNASASGASNKGPSNEDYLKEVEQRIDRFMEQNPGIKRSQVPAELLTASGSGLDPHISVASANVQVARIAKARGLSEAAVVDLINQHLEKPLWNLFGPAKIHLLTLNIALDKISKQTGGNHAD